MKILILTGSPRSKGTTSLLADEFAKGAKEAGHEVVRFDTGILDTIGRLNRLCNSCILLWDIYSIKNGNRSFLLYKQENQKIP